MVLVDQPTKDLGSPNISSADARKPIRVSGHRRELIKCAMRAVSVVVPLVLGSARGRVAAR